jgi:hypothetical protein
MDQFSAKVVKTQRVKTVTPGRLVTTALLTLLQTQKTTENALAQQDRSSSLSQLSVNLVFLLELTVLCLMTKTNAHSAELHHQ